MCLNRWRLCNYQHFHIKLPHIFVFYKMFVVKKCMIQSLPSSPCSYSLVAFAVLTPLGHRPRGLFCLKKLNIKRPPPPAAWPWRPHPASRSHPATSEAVGSPGICLWTWLTSLGTPPRSIHVPVPGFCSFLGLSSIPACDAPHPAIRPSVDLGCVFLSAAVSHHF